MKLLSKLIFFICFIIPFQAAVLLAQAPQSPVFGAPQFWIFELDERQNLVFNLPWDETPGDARISDVSDPRVPDYARTCLVTSEETLRGTLATPTIAAMWAQLGQAGATRRMIVVMNVLSRQNLYRQLASLDREPYFWHWNEDSRVPGLALSNYRRGSFIWEVVASPERCIQPTSQNVVDYLTYAARRLAAKR